MESIYKKFVDLEKSIACYGYGKEFIKLDDKGGYELRDVFANEIFENVFDFSDPLISKLQEYFETNKKIIDAMTYEEITKYKIEWNFT